MAEEAPADLIERAHHDRAAFGRLYDLYIRRIYSFAVVHSASREEAEDLTSQTFERALGAIETYEPRGAPFSQWVYRIAANLAIDRARRTGGAVMIADALMPVAGQPIIAQGRRLARGRRIMQVRDTPFACGLGDISFIQFAQAVEDRRRPRGCLPGFGFKEWSQLGPRRG